jgi:predicted Zn-dependent peptidase
MTARPGPVDGRAVLVDRSRLPEPGPARPFTFPSIEKSTLPNGLGVWTVVHAQVPVVSLMMLVRCGAAADPPGRDGLAATTADMLDEGSGDRSAIEVHEALARIGAQFDTDIGSDAIVVSTTVLSSFTDRALSLLSDVVVRPALRQSDFSRVRQLRLHRLTQLRDMPGAVADRAFLKLLYGDHPYGHAPIGNEWALTAMTVDDVRAFHAGAIRPSSATLIAVGDCRHDEIARIASAAFADWSGGASLSGRASLSGERNAASSGGSAESLARPGFARPDRLELPVSPRLALVPRPKAPQSELRIGQVTAARDTPDYHALVVANMILGGQFVSRINLNLREGKGFTYGARTAFEFRRLPSPFVLQVSVQTTATAEAIHEAIREIAEIRGSRPVTPEELALGTAALTRGYARGFETADQIARAVMQLALYDLPDDYFVTFVPSIERVTCDDVARVMTRHVDPARLLTLIVGDPDVGASLARLELGDPQILLPETF